jgi:nucleoside-diphosphate-sugar epimerase
MSSKILIIGSSGQIGTELVLKLRQIHGNDNIIASDIRFGNYEVMKSGPFEILDATSNADILRVVEKYKIKDVYLMVAMLSAIAEKNPKKAWDLNMNTLFHVLDLAKNKIINKVFWPSSIAVFGPASPKLNAPQHTILNPTTVYGMSKLAGENWCEYYHNKFGVDVRSIRYPGIISYKTIPGGGTTDYAIHMFHEAIKNKTYTSFLNEETVLPMMYMDDAIDATVQLMEIKTISKFESYNIAAMSFSPKQLAEVVRKYVPGFTINYKVDTRQEIANSWPKSIDDCQAKKDWNWRSKIDLDGLAISMFKGLNYRI